MCICATLRCSPQRRTSKSWMLAGPRLPGEGRGPCYAEPAGGLRMAGSCARRPGARGRTRRACVCSWVGAHGHAAPLGLCSSCLWMGLAAAPRGHLPPNTGPGHPKELPSCVVKHWNQGTGGDARPLILQAGPPEAARGLLMSSK